MKSLMHLAQETLLRVLLVFLVVSLFTVITLDHSFLREFYDLAVRFGDFLLRLGEHWGSASQRTGGAYARTLALLIGSLCIGLLGGVGLGLLQGLSPHSLWGRLVSLLSFLGIMTPSFLLGLAIMVLFVRYLNRTPGLQLILLYPTADLTADPRYLLAPTLTLAARPIAYIAHVTATTLRVELAQDYVRTARGKGLAARFNTSVAALAELNAIADPARIDVGQELRIPDGPEGDATSARP